MMTFSSLVLLESGSTESGPDFRPCPFVGRDRMRSDWPTTPFSFPILMSDRSLVKSGYLILGFRSVFLGNLRKLKIQVVTKAKPKSLNFYTCYEPNYHQIPQPNSLKIKALRFVYPYQLWPQPSQWPIVNEKHKN